MPIGGKSASGEAMSEQTSGATIPGAQPAGGAAKRTPCLASVSMMRQTPTRLP